MKRKLMLLTAVTVPALFAAGCASADPAPVAAGPPPTPSATDTTVTTPSTIETTVATPRTTATTPKAIATTKTAARTGRCRTADLTVTLGTGGGAAGTKYQNLVFTNKSASACTLDGYPGVSWVTGNNGTQVNNGFNRDPGDKKVTVHLKPGQVAHTTLAEGHAESHDKNECKPVTVRGYRVYPPDETKSIFVGQSELACSVKGVGVGRVSTISAGPGEAG